MPSSPELRANSSSLTASAGSSREIQAMPIKRSSPPQNAVMARVCARTAPYFTRVSSLVEKGAFADSVEKMICFLKPSMSRACDRCWPSKAPRGASNHSIAVGTCQIHQRVATTQEGVWLSAESILFLYRVL